MWELFKDIFKGRAFPKIPVSLKVKNFNNFKATIQNNKSNIQFLDMYETSQGSILNFKIIKKYPFFDFAYLPSYQFYGKVLKKDENLKLEGEFVEKGLSGIFQFLLFGYIFLLLGFLIFDAIFLFERGIEKNSYILLLINLGPFALFLFLALFTFILRKIENFRIEAIKAAILTATFS